MWGKGGSCFPGSARRVFRASPLALLLFLYCNEAALATPTPPKLGERHRGIVMQDHSIILAQETDDPEDPEPEDEATIGGAIDLLLRALGKPENQKVLGWIGGGVLAYMAIKALGRRGE